MHLFVDNLTNVDFSYLDDERGLVGETWLASITLEGVLDEQGMVCDFGIVKKTVRDWLDSYIDHCLVVAKQSKALEHSKENGNIDLTWQYDQEKKLQCIAPKEAITFIDEAKSITPQSVSAWCIEQLRSLLPGTIDRITLTFVPEPIAHHYYHYSHGLKKHAGNCQRIAHGHRSTIEIQKDGVRDHFLEETWCQQWRDIYVGTQEDLVVKASDNQDLYHHFEYDSDQGHFELIIPKEDCHLINTDSTVELIAQHIANTLKQQYPSSKFIVRAYEGIAKGAVAFS